MSNPLAVAAVTAVLKNLLAEAIKAENLSAALAQPAKAKALPPDRIDVDALSEGQLNLFLYHTTFNNGWRNVDLPSADLNGRRLSNPPAAIDLHYLVTAYGVNELETECLLGFALHVFHELRVLSRDTIRKALAPDPAQPRLAPLAAAGLADQIEQIKLTPQPLTTEDLSRLWSAIQSPMRPSAAYVASVVLIQREERIKSAPPVRSIGLEVLPFRQPFLDSVENAAGPREPTTADSTLVIRGERLGAAGTFLRLGLIEVPVAAARDDELRVELASLPAAQLRAGVQPVSIVRPLALGMPPVPHVANESNVAALVLRPRITVSMPDAPSPTAVNGVTTFSGRLAVTFTPRVGKTQRVQLLLDPWQPAEPGQTIVLSAPANNGVVEPQVDSERIDFVFKAVPPGTYLVRARVDGAESPLIVDTDPQSPTFGLYTGEPKVTLS